MKSIQLYDGTFTTFQAVLDLNEIKYELFEPSLNNAIVIDPENVKKFLIFALELSSLATINSNKKFILLNLILLTKVLMLLYGM